MKILILDDQQYRHDVYAQRFQGSEVEIVHTYNPDEAAEALGAMAFDIAFLDYDLNYWVYEPEMTRVTGVATAQLIASMPEDIRPRKVVLHSLSYQGADAMAGVLRSAGVSVSIEPFAVA